MNRLSWKQGFACMGCALALAGMPAMHAAAQKVDFSGKRIEVLVPFAPGGGSDVYVRAIAPHLERHLPGNPTIIVSASTVANYVLQRSKTQYELAKWQPALLSPQGLVVYVATGLGVEKPQDIVKLKGRQLLFGGESTTSGELRVIATFEQLGLDVKPVWELRRGNVRLVFERGELNLSYDSAPGCLKHDTRLVKAGKAVAPYSFGIADDKGGIVRDPNFPNLPTYPEAYELVHGKKPAGAAYEAWRALFQMGVMVNKGNFLPTDTPKDVVEARRTAARSMLQDPEFEKAAASVVERHPQFIGESARPIIEEATTLSLAV